MLISRKNLDAFLVSCMNHYRNSLVMRYANSQARFSLREFMSEQFLPAWKAEILKRMSSEGVDELDETIVLEGIHAKIYLEGGYAVREQEILKEFDPDGFRKFMDHSTREIFHENVD